MDDLSSSEDSLSEILSTISSIGHTADINTTAKFVIHTSTIPLSTIINSYYTSYDRPHQVNHKQTKNGCTNCMFENAKGQKLEFVSSKCGCRAINQPNLDSNLCYLEFLNGSPSALTRKVSLYEPKDAAFCIDHTSIFSDKYPATISNEIGAKGWSNISSIDQIYKLMKRCYWFTYQRVDFSDLFKVQMHFREFSQALKQTLYTIDGLLTKKFLALGPEISTYTNIASTTGKLFRDLFSEYLGQKQGCYKEIKDFLNHIKTDFHNNDARTRLLALSYDFKFHSINNFFKRELNKLRDHISLLWSTEGLDYTDSPAWVVRCAILVQTRILGYLPLVQSSKGAQEFREKINRNPKRIPQEELDFWYNAIQDEFRRENIPENFLALESLDETEKKTFDSIIERTEFVLKPSASVDTRVASGGKIEDARLLLQIAREGNWKIPIRDLATFDIIEERNLPKEEIEVDFNTPIFWYSVQICLNWLIEKGKWTKDHYYHLPYRDTAYRESIADARILHIREPGKDRHLTMSKATYTWALLPAGKVLNASLALLASHKEGLSGTNDAWAFNRRIAAESDESAFIYTNEGTGSNKLLQYFSDWTESTDFIEKLYGLTAVDAIGDYIGFWPKYMVFIKLLISIPQPVREVVLLLGEERERVPYEGFIRNGFMMGNPITKSILHSCHVVETSLTRSILEKHFSRRQIFNGKYQLGSLSRINKKQIMQEIFQEV